MARLKGLSNRRIVFVHALPNALGPTIQVAGLNILYLAGGWSSSRRCSPTTASAAHSSRCVEPGPAGPAGDRAGPRLVLRHLNIATDVATVLVTPRSARQVGGP